MPTMRTILLSLCLHSSLAALEPFSMGTNMLMIGNSFFIEMTVAMDYGIRTFPLDYPNHQYADFFEGGSGGYPENLWVNNMSDIEPLLSADVELFGLTFGPNTTVEDLVLWVDLALDKNPGMAIFLGAPWTREGPNKTTTTFTDEINEIQATTFSLTQELRDFYPAVPIYFINYGYVAQRMRELYDAGLLDDIVDFCCVNRETDLFRDASPDPGHQGDMMRDVAALFFLQILYGDASTTLPMYNNADVQAILTFAQSQNAGLNDQVLAPTAPTPTSSAPTTAPAPGCQGFVRVQAYLDRFAAFFGW